MPQKPITIPKIRLVSDRTPTERIVFYCVRRDTPGAKSPNIAIKNRVATPSQNSHTTAFTHSIKHIQHDEVHADCLTSRLQPPTSTPATDIEPPPNVPYINGLAEHERL